MRLDSFGLVRLLSLALLVTAFNAVLSAQTTTLSATIQPPASTIPAGTNDALIYQFTLLKGPGGAQASFTALSITDNGTRANTDYTAYHLYHVSQTFVETFLATSTSPNTSFSGFTQALPNNQPTAFVIRVDVPASASNGETFQISVAATDVTVSAGTVTGGPVNGNTHTISTTTGNPAIEVRDVNNTDIGNPYDLAAAQGDTPVAGQTYTFTIHNVGTGNLDLTGTPPVQTGGEVNCTVTVTQPTNTSITAGNPEPFDILIDPTAAGAFSFSIVIQNNTGTPYLSTISGNAVAPSATDLVIATQPGGGTGGIAWSQQPVVEAHDGSGLVNTFNGTVTAAISAGPGGANLLGTVTVTASNGVATFTDLAIDLAGTGYELTFTSGSLNPDTSNPFDITVGAATQIVISVQPGNGSGGSALSTQPELLVQDAGGNTVTTDNSTIINASITTGTGAAGAQIVAGADATASAGVVTFAGLAIDLADTGYTLDFEDSGSSFTPVTSDPFDVLIGAAAALRVATHPGSGSENTVLPQQPVIEIVDAGGNVVDTDNTTEVTASITTGTGTAGAVLGGTNNPAQAASGVVTFTDLEIDLPGTDYTLDFADVGAVFAPVTSDPFDIAGAPAQFAVQAQPGGAVEGQQFVTQPVIEVQDSAGSVITSDNTTEVTVSISAGTGNFIGGSTLTVQAVNGIVTFTDLGIDTAGAGFELLFEDTLSALTDVTSAAFDVAGAATQLVIVTQPGGAAPGTPFTQQPVIEIHDANGVLVATDSTTEVVVSITAGTGDPGATLSGTLTIQAVNGVVTFTDLEIDLAGTGYTLDFEDVATVLAGVTSASFDVSSGGGGGGGGGKKDSGCSTDTGSGWLMLLALLAGLGVVTRLRRSRA